MRSTWLIAAVLVFGVCCASCRRVETGGSPQRVVLYSSVDGAVLREVVAAFESETGIRVDIVGDTEATKTTGLVARLLSEQDNPRADVWWSSEPFGTIRLARAGVLEAYESPQETGVFGGVGWPVHLCAKDNTWYGFALRARVVASAPNQIAPREAPYDLPGWTKPRWKGRIGMARPAFGTTRGHMGLLLELWGAERFEAWLRGLQANKLRLYDGNASVVTAIAHGEIDVGLTDTDDVYAARANGLEIGMNMAHALINWNASRAWIEPPHTVPNTIGVVRGGPNAAGARAFVDFVLSGEAERILAASVSGNAPVHPVVAGEFPDRALPAGEPADYEAIADAIPEAMEICERVLGS